jgi:tungstate transport system permease protein
VDVLLDGVVEALRLLATGDEDTWAITALTLRVSATATVLALLVGVPVGDRVALGRFPDAGSRWPPPTPGSGCRRWWWGCW